MITQAIKKRAEKYLCEEKEKKRMRLLDLHGKNKCKS